jgi:hypothetical protein
MRAPLSVELHECITGYIERPSPRMIQYEKALTYRCFSFLFSSRSTDVPPDGD